jgi:hypothetical protein
MRNAALVLLLALTSCSAQYHRASASAEDPRAELAGLQRRIIALRDSSLLETAQAPDRCRKTEAVAEEICRCSERICLLAADLAENTAHLACMQARDDCRQARNNAEDCK